MKDLNIRPYFDDYSEDKQFYQILFRPTMAVQARELNQLQTILQEQIARHGQNIFTEGSMVIPGQISADTNLDYVKLESTYDSTSISTYLSDLIGETIELTGMTSGIKAKVSVVKDATSDTPVTIWVKYTSSGDTSTSTGTVKQFQANEILKTNHTTPLYVQVQNSTTAVGKGSSANIQRGVYFVNSRFVLAKEQTIILDAYGTTPSYRVGLKIEEDFITPEEDESLYDNSQGSTNYAAPGAHRYFIDLVLTKFAIDDTTDKNFVELMRINKGVIESKVTKTDYAILEDALARRTYDESGNYSVRGFSTQVKEHRSNDRGEWTANTVYQIGDIVSYGSNYYVVETSGLSGTTSPTHTIGSVQNGNIVLTYTKSPSYNLGVYSPDNGGDSAYMAAVVDAGKAYVYGYEIEKQSTTNVKVRKASEYKLVRSAAIHTDIGSLVQIDNVYGPLDFTKYPTVNIMDRYTTTTGTASGSVIGTARVRYVEYDTGTIGSASCKYVASLFDVKMNSGKDFNKNARQLSFTNTSGVAFTCDIAKTFTILSGSITTTSSTTAVSGIGTKFTNDLVSGSAIAFYSGSTLYTGIVDTITTDTALTLTANAAVSVSNAAVYSITPDLYEFGNETLLFPLPSKYTRNVKDVDDQSTTNVSYYVKKSYSAVVSGGVATISTSSSNETFVSAQQPDAYMVVSAQNGAVIPATISLNTAYNVATITTGTTYNTHTVIVIATTRKVAKERTKTIVRAAYDDITSETVAKSSAITLSRVDGIRLIKVSEFVDSSGNPVAFGSAIPTGSTEVDITSRYSFDSGCRDGFYDFISIKNTSGTQPRSPIRIYVDCHEHSTGDYFTVDSYQNLETEKYTATDGTEYSLYDCFDFRPTRNSSGFVTTNVPAIGFDIVADYSYYLPRIDKLSLSSVGNFIVTEGVADDSPVSPATPENSMLLYTFTIYPSVYGTTAVSQTKEDNRRYTMRDIGDIDRRLANVEYYTALSLLETQTNNLQLYNSDGTLGFKNGFIVDSLQDQSIAKTDSDEFKCSIDISDALARPAFSQASVNLIEGVSSDTDRISNGYVNNNGIITLPFTTSTFANQPFATMTESVTPYIQLDFIGNMNITPSSDEWYEVEYAPSIVVSKEGNFTALEKQYKKQLGTVWNSWTTTWQGSVMTTTGINRAIGSTATRTGVTTTITAVYDTEVVDDRTIVIDVVPYIRSRTLSFVATGMKPNTAVYPYFENTSMYDYVEAATKITLSGKSGSFDQKTSAGSDSDSSYRSTTTGSTIPGLANGDVIHNGASGTISSATATAVVLMDEDSSIRVANIKGTFAIGDKIYGTISGAYGTITAITTYSSLVTNEYGDVAGLFTIPCTDSIRFATGERTFTLTDSTTNGTDYTTNASAKYNAVGYVDVRQKTIVSTRNGVITKTFVHAETTLDPLAQSFTTPSGNGIFVSDIVVYFAAKDRSLPVFAELREMSNGYPTTNVIPGSAVTINPSDVNVSSDSSVGTTIKMEYPVYLDSSTDYCIVLLSDSPYYQVWVSQLGGNDMITGQRISKQPYLGSLFKSQNASTWDASQLQDLKFKINQCVFSTNSAEIPFVNQEFDVVDLDNDAFYTTSGSSVVRVRMYNHGLSTGSKFTISNVASTINGIASSAFNGQHTVLSVNDVDHVLFDCGSSASASGSPVLTTYPYATHNTRFDMLNLSVTQLKFENTSIKHFATLIDDSYTSFGNPIELAANGNTSLTKSATIFSTENETFGLAGKKSLKVYCEMQTTDTNLSPVLDTHRYSLYCIGNRIDANDFSTKVNSTVDGTAYTISATLNTNGTIVGAANAFTKFAIGQKFTISGATNSANNLTALITNVSSDGSTLTTNSTFTSETKSLTFTVWSNWFDEISTNGTSLAKYIMKPLVLSEQATELKIYFDVKYASPAAFTLYYRVSSNANDLQNTKWTAATISSSVAYSSDGSYNEAYYDIVSPISFNNAQIKIVMNSTNTAIVPSLKKIRLIAIS